MLVFAFSDIPVYLEGFCKRWKFNWPYACLSAVGGIVWATARLLLRDLPLMGRGAVDAILVSCLLFSLCKYTNRQKASEHLRKATEDEIRNGLQIIVYAVAVMDQGEVYMPQIKQGIKQVENALRSWR